VRVICIAQRSLSLRRAPESVDLRPRRRRTFMDKPALSISNRACPCGLRRSPRRNANIAKRMPFDRPLGAFCQDFVEPLWDRDNDVASAVNLLLSRLVPMQMKRRGVEARIVLQGDSTHNRVDLPLLKAVARARRWADDLVSGKVRSVGELARREGLDGRSVRRLIPLGFLSPRIIEAIAEGRQPVELTVEALTRRIDLPLLWSAQEQALGMKSVGDVDSSIASRRRYQPAIGARALR
jgi:hypothetical protein